VVQDIQRALEYRCLKTHLTDLKIFPLSEKPSLSF